MMRVALLTLVFLSLMVTPAMAGRWSDADVAHAMQVADDHWSWSPCYRNHEITWGTHAELASIISSDTILVIGVAEIGKCHVWIAWDSIYGFTVRNQLIELCSILEHEYGHNAGLEHSSDKNNVMNPIVPHTPECIAAFPRPKHKRLHS